MSHRIVCSSVSKTGIELHEQNAAVAEGNTSAQLLQHLRLRWQLVRSPRPVSYLHKSLISINCGFVFTSMMHTF